jgi:hypothetical protein
MSENEFAKPDCGASTLTVESSADGAVSQIAAPAIGRSRRLQKETSPEALRRIQ